MQSQISVCLLFVLFTAGHSIRCYVCRSLNNPCVNRDVECPKTFFKCWSFTTLHYLGNTTIMSKGKECAVNCQNGSSYTGTAMTFSACCDTDLCNAENTPDPRTIAANGLKCYSCDEKSCTNIVNCTGSEDHCKTITQRNAKGVSGEPMVQKGCASKSICDASLATSVQGISCCSGNLCNEAKSVTKSFLILCFPLITFILML
ncbi:urokinase plasminogen activator surface receptor-like [Danio aesculapii]|uniref:urokinase plasminogen activator surface receptor-like n=1 Tax=Danio aesculapii TaxID=1142201 RepID=UPI0024C0A436|nr:urokinase plasminogen activator surface receptor-like [Danio aesculapii]